MEISACPACKTMDLRFEATEIVSPKVVSGRSEDDRPVFVADKVVLDPAPTTRIVCVNGHAHPDRVGFDLDWA